MPTIEKHLPEYIRLDGGTQPRAKIDQAVCDEYAERMKAGEKFPPIDVFFDGEDYWLADGFHRISAYVMAVPGEANRVQRLPRHAAGRPVVQLQRQQDPRHAADQRGQGTGRQGGPGTSRWLRS